jgi:DJ-1/PfpI family
MLFGIFIYDGVEPIDLAAYGVLSMARRIRPEIEICTLAPQAGMVRLANGLRVTADHGIAEAPAVDVLIVVGGPGWAAQSEAPETLAFIRREAARILVASVCTGAMLLAASGILDGKPATTKREVVPPEESPLQVMRRRRSQHRRRCWSMPAQSSPAAASPCVSTRYCTCCSGCSARRWPARPRAFSNTGAPRLPT